MGSGRKQRPVAFICCARSCFWGRRTNSSVPGEIASGEERGFFIRLHRNIDKILPRLYRFYCHILCIGISLPMTTQTPRSPALRNDGSCLSTGSDGDTGLHVPGKGRPPANPPARILTDRQSASSSAGIRPSLGGGQRKSRCRTSNPRTGLSPELKDLSEVPLGPCV